MWLLGDCFAPRKPVCFGLSLSAVLASRELIRLNEAGLNRRNMMKKFLLATVGVMALAAPAAAVDLPARTYTKAPAYIAAVYDWSGFYIGANGGWGSSRDSWNSVAPFPVGSEGSPNGNGGT